MECYLLLDQKVRVLENKKNNNKMLFIQNIIIVRKEHPTINYITVIRQQSAKLNLAKMSSLLEI